MRRGLMTWSEAELPKAELQARVAAVAIGMRTAGLHGVLVNTNFSRPADVSWLTGFTPYWNQGVLVVTPEAAAIFVCALSRRVADWMLSVSRMDEIVCTQDIGGGLAKCLPSDVPVRLGVVDLADFPAGNLAKLRVAHPSIELVEASGLLMEARRQNADGIAIPARLEEIVQAGLKAGLDAAIGGDANAMIAAAERICRLEGAEEVLPAVVPDLATDGRLRRIEGGCVLGERFALQLSVAYKGLWCRVARSVVRGPDVSWMQQADVWFDTLPPLERTPGRALATSTALLDGAIMESWRIEGAGHGLPIGVVAGSTPFKDIAKLPQGRFGLFVRLRCADSYWVAARTLPPS